MNAIPARAHAVDLLLCAAAAALVVAGAWSAHFTTYDDLEHISQNPLVDPDTPLAKIFEREPGQAYIPVTTLSWRLDRWLFADWMPPLLGTWAPGVRALSALYHALAAWLLGGFLLRLGLGRRASLFVALSFALHPTACETLCWATERKNALAGLFGFATLWLWTAPRGETKESAEGRPILAVLTYALALASKQSALGLLPVLVCLEFFGGARGLRGEDGAHEPSGSRASRAGKAALRLAPCVLLAASFVFLGIEGHGKYIVERPGGSLFTALLTDAWVLLRYFVNLLAPVRLSAAYAVEPIVSLGDGRLWLTLAVLGAAVGGSLWLARSRARALFGWLWFLGALGPNLNLIAIPYVMADRFLYLALPGFFLVVVETAAGLAARWSPAAAPAVVPRWNLPARLGAAFLIFLAAAAWQRAPVWRSTYYLFDDAVRREPRSAFAHYGMGLSHATVWDFCKDSTLPQAVDLAARSHADWMREWETMFEAVDYDRQLKRADAALWLGERHAELREYPQARRFLQEALLERGGLPVDPEVKKKAEKALKSLPAEP